MNNKQIRKYHETKHVQDIVEDLKEELFLKNYVTDKTGCKTVELVNACFLADKDSLIRPKNEDYIKREIEWYMSQSLNVNDIQGETPLAWKQAASPNGFINSNYGCSTITCNYKRTSKTRGIFR